MIVVPCYNEAARLDVSRFAEYAAGAEGVELLFVDDGSTDATADLLAGLVLRMPGRIRALRLAANQGKSGAVRAGVLEALAGNAVFVGFWDADLATPLSAVGRFVSALEARPTLLGAIGARVKLMGTMIERSAARHYLGRLFATAASLVLGLAVYDTQCGAKLFRVNDTIREIFGRPFLSRWIFDVEIIARFVQLRGRAAATGAIYELPLRVWHDVQGSKLRSTDFLRALRDLWKIRRAYKR